MEIKKTCLNFKTADKRLQQLRRWGTKDGTKGLCVFFSLHFFRVVLETHRFSAVPPYSATLFADNTTPTLEDTDLLLGVEGGMWPVELTFGFTWPCANFRVASASAIQMTSQMLCMWCKFAPNRQYLAFTDPWWTWNVHLICCASLRPKRLPAFACGFHPLTVCCSFLCQAENYCAKPARGECKKWIKEAGIFWRRIVVWHPL